MGNCNQHPENENHKEVNLESIPHDINLEHYEIEKRNLLSKDQELKAYLNSNVPVKIEIEDGTTFEGEIKEGKANGTGTLTCPNFVYNGNWINGRPNGYGKITSKDGSTFEGNFVNGMCHGQGDFQTPNKYSYQGDFENGRMHGKGECSWPNGASYKGDFFQSRFHGYGVYRFPDGREFRGNYKLGVKDGQGEIFMPSDSTIVKGNWVNGQVSGQLRVVKGQEEVAYELRNGLLTPVIKV
jgi:hypothetical protein